MSSALLQQPSITAFSADVAVKCGVVLFVRPGGARGAKFDSVLFYHKGAGRWFFQIYADFQEGTDVCLFTDCNLLSFIFYCAHCLLL